MILSERPRTMHRLEEAGDALEHSRRRQAAHVRLERVARVDALGVNPGAPRMHGDVVLEKIEDEFLPVGIVEVEQMPRVVEREFSGFHRARGAAESLPRLDDEARAHAERPQVMGRRKAGQAAAEDQDVGLHFIVTRDSRRPTHRSAAPTRA